jgi:hypothetical protein
MYERRTTRGFKNTRQRIKAHESQHSTYEEEDTCILGGGYMHMRRRIHA